MTTQKEVFERLADLANGIRAEATAAAISRFPLDFSDEFLRETAIDELRDRGLYVLETLDDLSDEKRVALLAMAGFNELLTAAKEHEDYSFECACFEFAPDEVEIRKLCEQNDVELSGEGDLRPHDVTRIAARLAFSNNPFEFSGLLRDLREAFKAAGVSCAETFEL
jgi:hypothetical protein